MHNQYIIYSTVRKNRFRIFWNQPEFYLDQVNIQWKHVKMAFPNTHLASAFLKKKMEC